MDPIRTLFERDETSAQSLLPRDLGVPYGGDLRFPPVDLDQLYVVANFVSTLDGVVSFDIPGQSGGAQISGGNEGDRFIMGLLRASADAVLVGSSSVDAVSSNHLWIAEFAYPAAVEAYVHYRQEILKKPGHPLVAIVSGMGNVDLNRSIFHTPGVTVIIATSEFGREKLHRAGADRLASIHIRELPNIGGNIDPHLIVHMLANEFAVRLLLHEGGPSLLGSFLAADLLDELFLTIAPQIAGRSLEDQRPALVSHVRFNPATAPWFTLISAKQHTSHLYLRYRTRRVPPEPIDSASEASSIADKATLV